MHLNVDALQMLKLRWDLVIAHPPCTYLTVTGNRWFDEGKYGDRARERKANREAAVEFFMAFAKCDAPHVAIENPVGCMSTRWRKPDQIVQPYMFGDPFEKKTCLWLKGLEPSSRLMRSSLSRARSSSQATPCRHGTRTPGICRHTNVPRFAAARSRASQRRWPTSGASRSGWRAYNAR